MNQVYKVVLTGGPCGGKSTCISRVRDTFTKQGWEVFCCPEVPTIMLTAGAKFMGVSKETLLHTEAAFLDVQRAFETNFYRIAKNCGKNAVIIFDRGCIDVKAYLPDDLWKAVLKENNDISEVSLRDSYHAVIHLVTAARGAEKFYTTQNNAVRAESVDQAKELDAKVLNAWLGHRNHVVVENVQNESFDQKVDHVVEAVGHVLGLVNSSRIQKSYLLSKQYKVNSSIISNVDIRFYKDGRQLIKREQDGVSTYTVKMSLSGSERILTGREYAELISIKNDISTEIKKQVQTFSHDGQIFKIDTYGSTGLCLIRTYGSGSLPPAFVLAKLVDSDKYSDYAIAIM